VLTAEQVLRVIAEHPYVMGVLDGGPCAIQHVSERVTDGPDKRLDGCPCSRKLADGEPRQLGGGQYISSADHTLGDLVRDALAAEPPE
jgi:hypothetical protein